MQSGQGHQLPMQSQHGNPLQGGHQNAQHLGILSSQMQSQIPHHSQQQQPPSIEVSQIEDISNYKFVRPRTTADFRWMGFLRTAKPDRNNRYTAKCEFCDKIIPDARVEKLARHFIDTGNPLQLCTVASQTFVDAYTSRYEENRKEAMAMSNTPIGTLGSGDTRDKLLLKIRRKRQLQEQQQQQQQNTSLNPLANVSTLENKKFKAGGEQAINSLLLRSMIRGHYSEDFVLNPFLMQLLKDWGNGLPLPPSPEVVMVETLDALWSSYEQETSQWLNDNGMNILPTLYLSHYLDSTGRQLVAVSASRGADTGNQAGARLLQVFDFESSLLDVDIQSVANKLRVYFESVLQKYHMQYSSFLGVVYSPSFVMERLFAEMVIPPHGFPVLQVPCVASLVGNFARDVCLFEPLFTSVIHNHVKLAVFLQHSHNWRVALEACLHEYDLDASFLCWNNGGSPLYALLKLCMSVENYQLPLHNLVSKLPPTSTPNEIVAILSSIEYFAKNKALVVILKLIFEAVAILRSQEAHFGYVVDVMLQLRSQLLKLGLDVEESKIDEQDGNLGMRGELHNFLMLKWQELIRYLLKFPLVKVSFLLVPRMKHLLYGEEGVASSVYQHDLSIVKVDVIDICKNIGLLLPKLESDAFFLELEKYLEDQSMTMVKMNAKDFWAFYANANPSSYLALFALRVLSLKPSVAFADKSLEQTGIMQWQKACFLPGSELDKMMKSVVGNLQLDVSNLATASSTALSAARVGSEDMLTVALGDDIKCGVNIDHVPVFFGKPGMPYDCQDASVLRAEESLWQWLFRYNDQDLLTIAHSEVSNTASISELPVLFDYQQFEVIFQNDNNEELMNVFRASTDISQFL